MKGKKHSAYCLEQIVGVPNYQWFYNVTWPKYQYEKVLVLCILHVPNLSNPTGIIFSFPTSLPISYNLNIYIDFKHKRFVWEILGSLKNRNQWNMFCRNITKTGRKTGRQQGLCWINEPKWVTTIVSLENYLEQLNKPKWQFNFRICTKKSFSNNDRQPTMKFLILFLQYKSSL